MNKYKELHIWKRSIELVFQVYEQTSLFPKSEKFGLVDQIRRAATSIPSNIAEGCGRVTSPQTAYFINVSIGSLCELETQLIISSKLKYIAQPDAEAILSEIDQLKKMTWSFFRSVKSKD